MITSTALRTDLRKKWGLARDRVWLRNREFKRPTRAELESVLHSFEMPSGGECEDYATMFHAHARRERVDRGIECSWSIGECLVSRFLGYELDHALNIAYTIDSEIILVEPKIGASWGADAKLDTVYMIWM